MQFFNHVYESWRDTQYSKYRDILSRWHGLELDGKLVVDIGSSTGFLFDFLSSCGINAKLVCVDIDKEAIKHNNCDARIIGDAHLVPLKEHTFDIMFCIDVVHLLESLDTRPLKPGGTLVLGLIKRHEKKFYELLESLKSDFHVLDIFEINGREEEKVAILMKI